ncbi:MAG: hypothetical protein PHD86_03495 [Kiritimatiellae bacterium]|nr:hypothetical protein [Kiritimatiellia bacterium]
MKIELTEIFEHKGIEYEYTAVIYQGDDAYAYPDEVRDLERTDGGPVAEDVYDEVVEAALDHANAVCC